VTSWLKRLMAMFGIRL